MNEELQKKLAEIDAAIGCGWAKSRAKEQLRMKYERLRINTPSTNDGVYNDPVDISGQADRRKNP